MQLPECSSLTEYRPEVEKLLTFLEREKARTGKEVRIYPGHAQQILSDIEETGTEQYGQQIISPMRMSREVLELTEKILANPEMGEIRQIDYPGLEHVRVRCTGERLLYELLLVRIVSGKRKQAGAGYLKKIVGISLILWKNGMEF